MLNENILKIFKEMKNVGRIKDASGQAKEKNKNGSEVLEFFILISEKGELENATFKAFGPPALFAISSTIIDFAKNKSISEIYEINQNEILSFLKIEKPNNLVEFALQTFRLAISNYYIKEEKKQKK